MRQLFTLEGFPKAEIQTYIKIVQRRDGQSTYRWTLKNNISRQTKQKQTHRHRGQSAGCLSEGVGALGEEGEGVEQYRLAVTKRSQRVGSAAQGVR